MTPVKQLVVQFLKSQHSLTILGQTQDDATAFISEITPELKEDVVLFNHAEFASKSNKEIIEAIKAAKQEATLSGKRILFVAPVGIPVYIFEGSAVIEVTKVNLGDALFGLGKLAYRVIFTKCRGYTCDGFETVTLTG